VEDRHEKALKKLTKKQLIAYIDSIIRDYVDTRDWSEEEKNQFFKCSQWMDKNEIKPSETN